jgi:hypothetical protein
MREQKRVPDWLLERFAQGERPELQAPSEALQALQASNAEILARYPASQMAQEIQRRASQQGMRQRSAPWSAALIPAFAALALAVWVGRGYLSPEAPLIGSNLPTIEDTLPKGLSLSCSSIVRVESSRSALRPIARCTLVTCYRSATTLQEKGSVSSSLLMAEV